MPKIIRNEIEYSSTTSTANQINYLNTTSGLSATNVQSAIDEVTSLAVSSLPTAYIRFSGTDSIAVWSDSATTYDNVTITDEYDNSLTPANLINSNQELIYDLQIEYIRLNSSDEIIARYVFRDINAQTQTISDLSVFLISCNMIWGEIRAFVNFTYALTSPPRYTAKCYMFPITYSSKTAASSGTDLSLVTTGEKYSWNNKQAVIPQGSATSLNANNLYGEGEIKIYRSVSGSITNIPGVDGTLMSISNGSGYSTTQIFVNFNGEAYLRNNWGAGSVSWQGWKPINAYKTSTSNNLQFYRKGDVVYFAITNGSFTTNANGQIVINNTTTVIPTGYRPIANCQMMETNLGYRMTANTDGILWCVKTSSSGLVLRVSGCWITDDLMPT